MALDGAFLQSVRKELDCLTGGRVDRIHQPSKDEVIISVRQHGQSVKVLFCVNASASRVHITESESDNPNSPPMFCMLLRKHLLGGRLAAVRQDGLERVLFFDFDCTSDIGDKKKFTAVIEIMGKYSNFMLLDSDGKIIDSLKRVTDLMSRYRVILPGMMYEMPPRTKRLLFTQATREEMLTALRNSAGPASKALLGVFEGVSPVLTREWAYFAASADKNIEDYTAKETDRLLFAISQAKERLLGGGEYTIIKDKNGLPKDFTFIKVYQYGRLMQTCECGGASETLDRFYMDVSRKLRLKQRAEDLFKTLLRLLDRISKRIEKQQADLLECKNREQYKVYGDLIT
ncbi:MAG: NFACT family protein, partial [Oscillospiraceae bacterium]|nr:NFACT family protein [Oscillospiraceae bacterium]